MTKAERREVLDFARAALSGPDRSISLKAAFLLKKYAKVRRPLSQRKVEKKEKQLSKKVARADVRAACVERAAGLCECGCGRAFGVNENTAEWDEFYGRKHVTVEETWMLARACHRSKTENEPTRRKWDEIFALHCWRYDYPFRPRATKTLPTKSAARQRPQDFKEQP